MIDTLIDTWNQHVHRNMPSQFEESKHPRDHGKFASKGDGAPTGNIPVDIHNLTDDTWNRQRSERTEMEQRHQDELNEHHEHHNRKLAQSLKRLDAAKKGSSEYASHHHHHSDLLEAKDREHIQLHGKHAAERDSMRSRHIAEQGQRQRRLEELGGTNVV